MESGSVPRRGCAKPSQTPPRCQDSRCLPKLPAWAPGEMPVAAPALPWPPFPLLPPAPGPRDGATAPWPHLLLQAASVARARLGARSLPRLGEHHSSSRLPGGSFRLARGYYRGVIGRGSFVPNCPIRPHLSSCRAASWVPSGPPGTAHFPLFFFFFLNFLSIRLLPKGPMRGVSGDAGGVVCGGWNLLPWGREQGGCSEERSGFSSRFQPPAWGSEGAGAGADCLHPPLPEVTSSSSSPTADVGPERWGIPQRQRTPGGALPLGGPEDGGAAEELAGGVRLHPPPLHRLPPGVGGALQHQGRAGNWGGHGDPKGCWRGALRCRGWGQDACLWVAGVWGTMEWTVHHLPRWGVWGCAHPWVALRWRSPWSSWEMRSERAASRQRLRRCPRAFRRGTRLSAGTQRIPRLWVTAPASPGTAGKGSSEPPRPGRDLAQWDTLELK